MKRLALPLLGALLTASVPVLAEVGATRICAWKGDRRAAVSLTYDDMPVSGFRSLHVWDTLHQQACVFGDVGVVTRAPGFEWAEMRTILAHGWLRPAAHSHTHPHLTELTDAQIASEFQTCNEIIAAQLGRRPLALIYPFGDHDERVVRMAAQHYVASRSCRVGPATSEHRDPHRLPMEGVYGRTTVAEVDSWLDRAVREGTWLITMSHSIAGINDGWEPAPMDVYERLIGRTGELAAAGVVWSGHLEEVAKYQIERQHTGVLVKDASSGRIELTLAFSPSLNPATFDSPLTFSTKVPADWAGAVVRQSGRILEATLVSRGEDRFVQWDALPSAGNVILTRAP